MLRTFACVAATLAACPVCLAGPAERPTTYDEIIAREAKAHGVPEAFVHRTVMRESRYNPHVVHHHCYGLMQIKHATAREMGYKGDARGLLDPQTNLTYAIPYLANAYKLADGDEDRATALFRSGYYYFAKRKRMLSSLQTASSQPPAQEPAPESLAALQPPPDPFTELFSALAAPAAAAPPATALLETASPEAAPPGAAQSEVASSGAAPAGAGQEPPK
jgi:hypothetical protein